MRVSLSAAAALLSLLQSTVASASSALVATTAVTLTLPPQPALPNPHALPPSTHATLSTLYTTYSAPLSVANTFVFRNVTPGSYLADVHCATHAFHPLRVDVVASSSPDKLGLLSVQAWETFRGNDWDNKGEEAKEIALPGAGGPGSATTAALPVRCLAPKQYFMERSSFSIMGILKNPMILLAMVSMGIFFVMPKMVENMDPEMRAEFEEQQKNNPMASLMGGGGQQAANPLGNFDMASFLAGAPSKKDDGGSSSAAAPAPDAGNGGGRRKK
ncbi:hypothetical protein PG995_015260 [Apiospora arundinis]